MIPIVQPTQDAIGGFLAVDVATGQDHVVAVSPDRIYDGPAWMPDGSALITSAMKVATWPLAESLGHAGGCPLTPKSAIESHLGFAESFRVHEPISTSQFAAVAALPPRNNSLRYTTPPET